MSDPQATGTGTNDAGEPQVTLPNNSEGAPNSETKPTDPPAPKPGEQTSEEIVYEFQMPEGVQFADGEMDEFKNVAKDLKLPKDAAQKIVDIATKREQARSEAFVETVRGWEATTKADKELGKDENLALAKKAIDTFGSPELKAVLDSSGLGNHPEVVRAFLKIGRQISEDSIVGKGNGSNATRDTADILYGTPTKT
jgi:hypothetical protein